MVSMNSLKEYLLHIPTRRMIKGILLRKQKTKAGNTPKVTTYTY